MKSKGKFVYKVNKDFPYCGISYKQGDKFIYVESPRTRVLIRANIIIPYNDEEYEYYANRRTYIDGVYYDFNEKVNSFLTFKQAEKFVACGSLKQELKVKEEIVEIKEEVIQEEIVETEEVKPIKYGALAKEYNLSFTDLKLAISSEFEIEVKSHNSNIKLEMLPKFREFLDRVAFKAEE